MFVSAVSFLSWGKGSSPFFSCLTRLKKPSTKYYEPQKPSSFALILIDCDLSHPDIVDIENFIENFKL